MKITSQNIEVLLRQADIEGYIELGAPADEYASEAEIIAAAINELERPETSEENIAAIIFQVWKKSFNLSASDLEARQSAVNGVVKKIMKHFSGAGV